MTTKIPAELSSTPGIADSSDATAITITSAEKVGIGTANPSQLLTVESNSFPILQISNTLANNPADGAALDIVEKQDGYAASTATFGQTGVYGYRLKLNGSTNELILQSGSQTTTNDRVTVERDTGNVTLDTGNLVIGTAGKGIDFSATGTPGGGTVTVNSSLLDDYEEGTWTPTFAGVAAAAVYGARYTKIGQLVMVESYVAGDTQNNTNQFQIGGLPYTSQNVTAYGGGSIQYTSSQDYTEFGGPLIPANSTYIYFHRIDGSSSSSVTNNILYNKINGNQLFIFQAFYRTA